MINSNSIPIHLKELLKNLEYLAMIETGMKPCLSDMTFVDANSWLGAWKRSRMVENKKALASFIDQVIEQALAEIKDNRNKEYLDTIVETLSRAKLGIKNTLTTYQDYPVFTSNIKVILSNIDRHLKNYILPSGVNRSDGDGNHPNNRVDESVKDGSGTKKKVAYLS